MTKRQLAAILKPCARAWETLNSLFRSRDGVRSTLLTVNK